MSNLGLFEPSDSAGSSTNKPSHYILSLIVKYHLSILCLCGVVVLLAYIRVKTDLLGAVDPFYVALALMGLSLLNWFLVRKEIKKFNDSVYYVLVFVVCISAFFVYSFFNDYVVYRLATFTQVETITSENFEEMKGYNYIELKKVDIDATKSGSITIITTDGRHTYKNLYQVFPFKTLPHVYLGVMRTDEKPRVPNLHGIIVRPVTDDFTYRIYNDAIRECEGVHPLINQVDCFVFEISSVYTRGAKGPLRIFITLLIGNILIIIICAYAGPKWIYEIERDSREPLYSDWGFKFSYFLQPNFIPYYIILATCIVLGVFEIFNGFGAGVQNFEVVDRLGAASYYRIYQQHEYWRIIAANFIPDGLSSLLIHPIMFGLAVFVCKLSASDRGVSDYYLSGVFMVGGIVSMLLVPYFQHTVIHCGVSSGVYAMYGVAMWHCFITIKNSDTSWGVLVMPFLWVGYNIVFFLSPHVSLLGHVIGFITGLLCAAVYHLLNPRSNSRW